VAKTAATAKKAQPKAPQNRPKRLQKRRVLQGRDTASQGGKSRQAETDRYGQRSRRPLAAGMMLPSGRSKKPKMLKKARAPTI
jgi:hypothetical protein